MPPSPRSGLSQATSWRLEEMLATEPCAVCAAVDERVESWFASYEHETNPDPDMKEWLADSFGLCTAHTRRLLDSGTSTSWLASSLFAEVARSGARRIGTGAGKPLRTCPPCAVARERATGLLDLLRTGLARDGRVRDSYTSGSGVCLTHLAALVRRAPAHVVHLVAERTARTLATGAVEATGVLAGADRDRRRRGQLWTPYREAVLRAEEQAVKASTYAYVDLVLTTPACPLCTATQRAEWRLLDWLATSDAPATDLQLDATLCGRHLGDLAAVGWPERADELALYAADRMLASLNPAVDRLATLRGPLPHRRAAAVAMAPVFRPLPCRACRVSGLAERDERRLLAIVADDASCRERLDQAHGLCLSHGHALDREGALPPAWRDLLRTRLRLLSFELDRAARQTARDGRWRTRGSELTAWRHAPTLLDGAVYGPRLAS